MHYPVHRLDIMLTLSIDELYPALTYGFRSAKAGFDGFPKNITAPAAFVRRLRLVVKLFRR